LDLDDIQLVQRVRSGDSAAFRTLVERYQKRVFGVALGMLKDRDEAEDAAQEVFLRVYRHLEHFKGDASFATWLTRITSNVCIDALRRRKSGGEREAFDEAHPELPASQPGTLASAFGLPADQAYLAAEAKQHHDAAVAQVPEKHRDIYELREREELSYEELSERLKIPKGTVMSRLFHARDKVEKLFRPYAAPEAEPPKAVPRPPAQDPAEVFLRDQMKTALSEALTRLPPKHREVLLLRELCQLSYPELAAALGVAEALVPGRVFDARNKFQKLLSEYVEMQLNPKGKKKADPRA